MEINGYTRTCGLIGNPVEHTMSPVIHNLLSEITGNNMVYVPFHVENENLEAAVKGGFGLNLLGMNVTVPYKSAVLNYLDKIDSLAEKIGAVNTLVRTQEGFKGYNTDMPGLYRGMCSEGIQIENEAVILLGAGGAARAVAFLCAEKGAQKIYLLNRSLEKAKLLAEEVNKAEEKTCVIPFSLEEYTKLPEDRYLAIQGTSVGLFPDVSRTIIEDKGFYRRIHTGYDLIYRPSETKFMQLVKEAGGTAYHGLKMLLYQGVIAYELWNQIQITQEDAMKVYSILKEKIGIEE